MKKREEKKESENKKKTLILIFLSVLLIILLYFLYLSILEYTSEPVIFVENRTIAKNQSSFSGNDFQFYHNMRFAKKDIIYNIDSSCSEEKKLRMEQAFSRLQEETGILRFYNNIYSDKSDILITCQETAEQIPGEYFTAGEGGPTVVINSTTIYVIEKGKVLLFYKKSQCNNYNVELHELLHVLGFKHSNNKDSIMYNTTSCGQIFTKDIIQELRRLYSIPTLPDLYFSNITAEKHGSYLDFEVEVRNQGLAESENVKLDLYATEKVDEFDLNNINYGEGKYLQVKNVKIAREANQLRFILPSEQELNTENNIAELFLP